MPLQAVATDSATHGACLECGEPLKATRRDKRFCSDRCRYAQWDRLNPRLPLVATEQPAQRLTDREREEYAKDRGMELAAARNAEWLERFREVAEVIAVAGDGTCDIDLVRAWFDAQEIDYRVGNFMGSIFKGDRWVCVGRVKTTHRGGHGREVRRWRLVR